MKKLLLTIIFAALLLTGCNYDYVDMVYSYDYAWISLPNGETTQSNMGFEKYIKCPQCNIKVKILSNTPIIREPLPCIDCSADYASCCGCDKYSNWRSKIQ